MFKFNFSSPDQEQEEPQSKNENNENSAKTENVQKEEGRIVEITSTHREKVEQYKEDPSATYSFRNFSLVNIQHLEEILSDTSSPESFKNLTTAIQMNSDVIKGVYEGTNDPYSDAYITSYL